MYLMSLYLFHLIMMPMDAGIAVMASRNAESTTTMPLPRIHVDKGTWVKE